MFTTQAEFDAYLGEIAHLTVPDLCESVLFKWSGKGEAEKHRVTGWYRAEPDIEPTEFKDWEDKMIWDLHEEDRAERRAQGNVRIRPCAKREDATHVAIYAVAGAVVRIDRITRTGEYVRWTEEHIQQEKDSWAYYRQPGNMHGHFNSCESVRAR